MRDLSPARQTEWPDSDLLWIAGLLEGEGSFTVHKTGAQIQCQMTDKDVIHKLHAVTGVGQVNEPRLPTGNGGTRPFWRWGVYRRLEVEALSTALYLYMGERRQKQIDAVLAHLRQTRRPTPTCGTYRMYQRGCRCARCKAASAAHQREARAKRKATK